jgi:hypothetical protein
MSGDMRIEGALAAGHEHTIETVSGDTRIITSSGLTIEARTVSGDIRSDVPHRTGGESGRRSIILGDGRARLGFRSLSGDLQLTGKGPLLTANEGRGEAWRRTSGRRLRASGSTDRRSGRPMPHRRRPLPVTRTMSCLPRSCARPGRRDRRGHGCQGLAALDRGLA